MNKILIPSWNFAGEKEIKFCLNFRPLLSTKIKKKPTDKGEQTEYAMRTFIRFIFGRIPLKVHLEHYNVIL
jgi:hypothetical protein